MSSLPKGTRDGHRETQDRLREFREGVDPEHFAVAWRNYQAQVRGLLPTEMKGITESDERLCGALMEAIVRNCPELTPEELRRWLEESEGWPLDGAEEAAARLRSARDEPPPIQAEHVRLVEEREKHHLERKIELQVRTLLTASPNIERDYEDWKLLERIPQRSQDEEKRFRGLDYHSQRFRCLEEFRAVAAMLGIPWDRLVTQAVATGASPAEAGRDRTSAPAALARFREMEGLTWWCVEISLISDSSLEFRARDYRCKCHIAELGLVDRRKGDLPRKPWNDLVTMIAEGPVNPHGRGSVEKRISDLRKLLKDWLGLTDNPFLLSGGEYSPRFRFKDKRGSVGINAQPDTSRSLEGHLPEDRDVADVYAQDVGRRMSPERRMKRSYYDEHPDPPDED